MALDTLIEETDANLLARFSDGDYMAARQLTDRHTPSVFRLAMRMLNHQADAEDVTQEVMVKIWKQAPKWREGEAKLSTWAYRVAKNLCVDKLRFRVRVGSNYEVKDVEDNAPSVEEKMNIENRAATLSKAMVELSDRQKMAVHLRHIEGLPNSEIASIMEISVDAVESLIARGKRRLKDLLINQIETIGVSE